MRKLVNDLRYDGKNTDVKFFYFHDPNSSPNGLIRIFLLWLASEVWC